MAPRTRTPGKEWLTDRIAEGRTDREMAELWFQQSGELVTPQAINKKVRTFDLRERVESYDDLIPWTVKAEHAGHYLHKLLYAEGHVRRGKPITERWSTSLKNFKDRLQREDAVVAYLPDSPDGFYLVKRRSGDDELTTTRGREDN